MQWTKLRKISTEAFSEAGRRNYGRPTCIAVATVIVLGTSKGVILVFDYHQNLKATIGLGTKAIESGAITAISLSADNSTVAGGHSNGNIFTWEIAKPGKPFLHIPSISLVHVQASKQDGHIFDVSVVHVGFLGTRHTALVSADDKGMAFSHLTTRGMGAIARTVRTTRILGRYPEAPAASLRPKKPSAVLAFSPLPLGNIETASDVLGLVAILTPYPACHCLYHAYCANSAQSFQAKRIGGAWCNECCARLVPEHETGQEWYFEFKAGLFLAEYSHYYRS